MGLLLIDNYDSFTWNLAHYLMHAGQEVRVVRNDAISLDDCEALAPSRICISPGPGRPEASGLTLPILRRFAGHLPIFGVCLGMQAIALRYGARLVHAPTVVHGKTSAVRHEGAGVFYGLPSPFTVARYHSLCVDPTSLPDCLEITARAEDGVIMGLRHREHDVEGVQFHPEAILTEHGRQLLENWLTVPVK